MAPDHPSNELVELAQRLVKNGPKKTMQTTRHVRIRLGSEEIVNTTAAYFVWEHDYYPQFYVPQDALRAKKDVIESVKDSQGEVSAQLLRVSSKDGRSTERVIAFQKGDLSNLIRFDASDVDGYYEEDLPVKGHPRDPFKRIDTLPSSRTIEVKLNGQRLAYATSSIHLIETSLPTRFYLPLPSITPGILQPSDKTTWCPYKGKAEYYNIVLKDDKGKEEIHKDLVWYYIAPLPESSRIQGLACFYNEKVEVFVDGVKEEKPKTHFA